MTELIRYSIKQEYDEGLTARMEQAESGAYVLYANAQARIQELEAALRIILALPSTDNVMDQASLVGKAYFAASDALGETPAHPQPSKEGK